MGNIPKTPKRHYGVNYGDNVGFWPDKLDYFELQRQIDEANKNASEAKEGAEYIYSGDTEPETDIESLLDIRNFLSGFTKGDVLKELMGTKVTDINSGSTDDEYPSAKAVWDLCEELQAIPITAWTDESKIDSGHTPSAELVWNTFLSWSACYCIAISKIKNSIGVDDNLIYDGKTGEIAEKIEEEGGILDPDSVADDIINLAKSIVALRKEIEEKSITPQTSFVESAVTDTTAPSTKLVYDTFAKNIGMSGYGEDFKYEAVESGSVTVRDDISVLSESAKTLDEKCVELEATKQENSGFTTSFESARIAEDGDFYPSVKLVHDQLMPVEKILALYPSNVEGEEDNPKVKFLKIMHGKYLANGWDNHYNQEWDEIRTAIVNAESGDTHIVYYPYDANEYVRTWTFNGVDASGADEIQIAFERKGQMYALRTGFGFMPFVINEKSDLKVDNLGKLEIRGEQTYPTTKAVKDAIDEASGDITELKERMDTAETNIGTLSGAIDDNAAEISNIKTDVEAISGAVSANTAEIAELKATKQDIVVESEVFTSTTVVEAIEEAHELATGRERAVSYVDYRDMVTELNSASKKAFKTGDNIFIIKPGVSDIWITKAYSGKTEYAYVSDEEIEKGLADNSLVIGYYGLAKLESKIDLTDVVKYGSQIFDDADGNVVTSFQVVSGGNIQLVKGITALQAADIEGKEDKSNKDVDEITSNSAHYPSSKLVKDALTALDNKYKAFSSTTEAAITSANAKIEALEDATDTIEDRVDAHDTKISTISGAVSTNTAAIASAVNRITSAETKIAAIDTKVETNTGDIATLSGVVSTNKSDIATLSGTVTGHTSAISTLSGAVSANTAAIATASTKMAEITTKVDTNTSDIATLSGVVSTNKSDIATLKEKVETISGDVADNTTAISTLNTAVDLHDTKIAVISGKVDASASAITSASTKISELGEDLTELSGTVTGHTSAISTLSGNVADNTAAISTLSSTVGQQETKIATLSGNVADNASAITTATTAIGAVSAKTSENAGLISGHSDAIDDIQADIRTLQTEVDSKAPSSDLRALEEELKEEIEDIKDDLKGNYQEVSAKTNAVTSASTNDQYPSAQAVFNFAVHSDTEQAKGGTRITNIVSISKTEYDALTVKDSSTIYMVYED